MGKHVSPALVCVNVYFRGGAVLGDDRAQGVDLREMAEAMAKSLKMRRSKDFGLVTLGPLASPGMLVGRL